MNEPDSTLDRERTPDLAAARSTDGLVRFFRERKSIIRERAITVVVTLLVLIIGLTGWRYYSQWRLGRVVLTNNGIPLLVQVLPDSGDEPMDEAFDVVRRSTLALPAGDYRLRVNGAGRLGRTYRFAVNRGETIAHELSLDEGRLLAENVDPSRWAGSGQRPREEPMPFAWVTSALELTSGRFDIVELTATAARRRDGASGKLVWDTANPAAPYGPGRDPSAWVRGTGGSGWWLHLMEPAMDLDADGTRDILGVLDNANTFVALSGKDGSLLWNYAAQLDGPGGPQKDGPRPLEQPKPNDNPARLVSWPAIGDVDGDGTPDMIATMVFSESTDEVRRRTGKAPTPATPVFFRRIVLAISGRSGHWLWTFSLDRTFAANNVRSRVRPAEFVRGRRSSLVTIEAGSNVNILDPATGRSRSEPVDLGFDPVRPVQFADTDGDGEPEILALGPGSAPNQQSMTVYSAGTGQERWTTSIAAKYPLPHENGGSREWPWLVDLDSDGRTEVVVPDSGPLPPKAEFRGVRVLDGGSGQTRWVRPMRPETKAEDGLERVIDAPDLDGDGVHELIAVSRFDGREPPASRSDRRKEPERVYVDALSGRDGHPLWSWREDLPENKFTWIGAPRWWGRGPDGWPLLAVPLGGRDPEQGMFGDTSYLNPPTVHVLEASTGRELNRVMGLSRVGAADLDGDGLVDLWGEADGQLRAFRAEPPEAWRALGSFVPARKADPWTASIDRGAADLDGDGIADALSAQLSFSGNSSSDETGSRTALARSGRDGHALWKTVLDPPWLWFWPEPGRSYRVAALPLPAGDLDGDGTGDILVEKFIQNEAMVGRQPAALPLELLSGRDGRHLWSAAPLPLGFEAYGFSQVTWFEPRVIEPNAPPDLLVLHRSPFVKSTAKPPPPMQGAPARERLARVSGRTGRIVWDIPLEEQPSQPQPGGSRSPKLDDFDGDGRLDAAVVVRRPAQTGQSEFELKVISLLDGSSRWSRMLHYESPFSDVPSVEIAKAAPNEPTTVFLTEMPTKNTSNELLVHALDGRDGTDRWTWRSGVGEGDHKVYGGIDAIALDHAWKDSVCVTYSDMRRECRIVILDAQGQERARRVLPPESVASDMLPGIADFMVDLDGDGRDELIVTNNTVMNAWGSDLKDRWSILARDWQILRVLPGSPGRSTTLVVPPARAIDGKSGQLRWIYKPSPPTNRYVGDLLDPGNSEQMPRLIISRNPQFGTVCRCALPATPNGDYAPPSGARPPAGLARDDPRWTRGLPWTNLMDLQTAWTGLLEVVGLALINVFLPLGILCLAARRRPWSLRALMALPIAAAVPLSAFLALEPVIPIPTPTAPLPSSPMTLFALGTAAGVPVVTYVVLAGWSLIRWRWRTLGLLGGLTVLASLMIAAIWLWADLRNMPANEHYSPSGWYVALLPGAIIASALVLIGLAIKRLNRWIRWRAMRIG